jgi:hypothetical protein
MNNMGYLPAGTSVEERTTSPHEAANGRMSNALELTAAIYVSRKSMSPIYAFMPGA